MKIQEIAKRAGVSTATVSRVFSNHPNIREELRERVLAAARQAGYHPRLSQKQQNVVVISPLREIYPIRSYVEMVISELALTLSARGYRIEMLPSDNLSQLERIRFCGAVSIGVDVESFGNWEERFAAPLVFDVTHSLQCRTPDAKASGGRRSQSLDLAKAGVSQKIAAIFLECHPNPDAAKCDGPSALPLELLAPFLTQLRDLDALIKSQPDVNIP